MKGPIYWLSAVLVLALGLLIVLLVWRPIDVPQTAPLPQPEPETTDAVEAERYGPRDAGILIGVIAERSGPAAVQNARIYKTVRHVIDQVNAEGGLLGESVAVLEFDNQTEAVRARRAAELAVAAEVAVVLGSARSSNSLAMAPVLQAAGIPMITPESTNPKVTRVGDYIFRTCFADDFQAKVLARFARDQLQADTAATITCAGRVFSTDLSRLFTESFEALGGRVVLAENYLETDADFTAQVALLQELQPAVVFIPSEARDSGLIIRQAVRAGVQSLWLGPDSWNQELYDFAGPAAEGAYYTTHWHRSSDRPQSRAFVARYEREVEAISREGIAMWYDAACLAVDAIRRAGNAEPAAIRDALAATTGFEGVTGTIRFDANGDPVAKAAVINRLQDGTSTYLMTIEP